MTSRERVPTLAPHVAFGATGHTVHDYYRIADVWDGSRRASPVNVRVPWWRTVPGMPALHERLAGLPRRVRVLEPETPMPAIWRDDAALDFPSLHGAAERMRRAFLAQEDPVACRAVAVDLPRAAAPPAPRASRVPVRIVVPTPCERCGGRGEAWGDRCVVCDGAGVEEQARYVLLRVPAGVRDGARLRYRLEAAHAPPLLLDVHVNVR